MTATMSSLILKRKWKFKFELVGPGRSAWVGPDGEAHAPEGIAEFLLKHFLELQQRQLGSATTTGMLLDCTGGIWGSARRRCDKSRSFAKERRGEMKPPSIDPRLRELVPLAALAAFGCGLALAHGDLSPLFLAQPSQ